MGDWGLVVLKNLDELEIEISISEIEKISEETFIRIVKESINEKAIEYLNIRMLNVRSNYKEKHFITLCPRCCNTEEDNQDHLLHCHKLDYTRTAVDIVSAYEVLFSSKLKKYNYISSMLK